MGEPLLNVKRNKFEIENTKVTIYPNTHLQIAFYIFAIIIGLMGFVLVYLGIKFNTLSIIYTVLLFKLATIIALLLIGKYIASKKIVFDKVSQEVYSIIGSSKKHLIYFNEIHDINKTSSFLGGNFYRIQPKNDLVSYGIRISIPYNAATISKQEKQFINDVLPKLDEMVFNSQTSTVNNTIYNTPKNIPTAINFINFKTLDYNTFEYAPKSDIIYVVIFAGILTGLIYSAIGFIPEDFRNGKPEWAAYFGLLLFIGGCIYGIYRNSQKIIIDKSAKTIIQTNFWGLLQSNYSFSDFEKYLSIKNYTNSIYSGTDLKIIFKNRKSIKVANKYKTQKIQQYIDELNAILF